jgi:hypothetical protein
MRQGICLTCRYFEQEEFHDTDEGNCHRMPPTVAWDVDDGCALTLWSVTEWTDWCGEWSGKEDVDASDTD